MSRNTSPKKVKQNQAKNHPKIHTVYPHIPEDTPEPDYEDRTAMQAMYLEVLELRSALMSMYENMKQHLGNSNHVFSTLMAAFEKMHVNNKVFLQSYEAQATTFNAAIQGNFLDALEEIRAQVHEVQEKAKDPNANKEELQALAEGLRNDPRLDELRAAALAQLPEDMKEDGSLKDNVFPVDAFDTVEAEVEEIVPAPARAETTVAMAPNDPNPVATKAKVDNVFVRQSAFPVKEKINDDVDDGVTLEGAVAQAKTLTSPALAKGMVNNIDAGEPDDAEKIAAWISRRDQYMAYHADLPKDHPLYQPVEVSFEKYSEIEPHPAMPNLTAAIPLEDINAMITAAEDEEALDPRMDDVKTWCEENIPAAAQAHHAPGLGRQLFDERARELVELLPNETEQYITLEDIKVPEGMNKPVLMLNRQPVVGWLANFQVFVGQYPVNINMPLGVTGNGTYEYVPSMLDINALSIEGVNVGTLSSNDFIALSTQLDYAIRSVKNYLGL